MLLLRQLTPLTRFTSRFYVAQKATQTMATLNPDMKQAQQVHQEMLRHINRNARINIRSDIYLKVFAADVHTYPDGDAFIAEMHGSPTKNCTSTMKIEVSDDEKQVDVQLSKVDACSDFHCELAVPIRADLHIVSSDVVDVSKMYGEELNVAAAKGIRTKNIRGGKITLSSESNIKCDELLLGQTINIETQAKGNILLDKLHGTVLRCKTTAGDIKTKSCYVEASTFETDTGSLQLKNVHKKATVFVYKKGELSMTGVNGNIYVRSNGGSLSLQLSQLTGENIVVADGVDLAKINISDAIEENSFIEIQASNVSLESALSHLSDCQSDDKKNFRMSTEPDNHNKLLICTKGAVSLGKLSWADSMRAGLASGGLDDK